LPRPGRLGARVYVFKILQQLGQIELVVTGSYVVLLGSIGGLMLNESIRTIRRPARANHRRRQNGTAQLDTRTAFKMRFRRSKLYISVIPPVVLGLLVGILTAIMGVAALHHGTGHDLSVADADQRGDRHVAIPDSVRHRRHHDPARTSDQTVDIVLAFLLVVGGVVGVQLGVRVGSQMRGEQLRALLAVLVF